MKRFDPKTWTRRDHYAWFRAMDFPYVGITADVDCTGVVTACKSDQGRGLGLFAAMLYEISEAANSVPQLRQRIRIEAGDDVVVEHDRVIAGVTLAVEGGLFTYANIPPADDVLAYGRGVAEVAERVRGRSTLDPNEGQRDDVLFMSCLPWVRFTDVTHAVPTTRLDSAVRISWGKIVAQGDRHVCPVNIQAHHAIVDGAHLGLFFMDLQRRLDGFELPT